MQSILLCTQTKFFFLYIFCSRHHLATPTHPPCHQTSSFGHPTHPPLWWRNTWMVPNTFRGNQFIRVLFEPPHEPIDLLKIWSDYLAFLRLNIVKQIGIPVFSVACNMSSLPIYLNLIFDIFKLNLIFFLVWNSKNSVYFKLEAGTKSQVQTKKNQVITTWFFLSSLK